jgi:hypothetical protein
VFFFAGPIRLSSGMFKRFEIGQFLPTPNDFSTIVLDDYSDKKKNERLADESKIREELLERKRAYRKQLRLNARRNAELCRRNVMQHLEVQLDSPKNPIDFATSNDDWIAADDDSVSDVDMDESSRFYLRDDHILELESWLAFRGTFESMQSVHHIFAKNLIIEII